MGESLVFCRADLFFLKLLDPNNKGIDWNSNICPTLFWSSPFGDKTLYICRFLLSFYQTTFSPFLVHMTFSSI